MGWGEGKKSKTIATIKNLLSFQLEQLERSNMGEEQVFCLELVMSSEHLQVEMSRRQLDNGKHTRNSGEKSKLQIYI